MELPQNIIKEVAKKYGLSVERLINKHQGRMPWFVRARREAIHRLRDELKLSYPEIGRWMGNRDHSTIIYQYKK